MLYPGLPGHPGHDVAAAQMRDFGGMVSFTLLAGGASAAAALVERTELFTLAESLGGGRVAHRAPGAHDPRRRLAGRPGTGAPLGRPRVEADLVADLLQALKLA